MARKPTKPCPKLPSFFKVLLGDDFPRKLCLPPAFMVHYNGPSHCKCALRGPTGKWWTVGLEEREDGFYFRGGWRRFLTDHSLKVGYFLVFDHQGGPKFDVTIYHPMGCDMRRSIGNSDKPGKRPATAAAVEETSTGSIVFRSEHPCFIRILGKNQYRMNIPKELAVAEGLIGKERVMLKDPNGRSWNVKLRLDNKEHHGGRLLMTQGLVACWQANNISLGDTIVFELVKRSEMEVHIFRTGAGGNMPSVVLDASSSSIPPEFMNYVNGRLPPTCTLRGPSGECWTVGLEQRGDRFVFHKGWQGFVKDHSLEIANFLVFDYDGKSKFDVTMYDGTEKELEPAEKRRGNRAQVEEEIIELETEEPDKESEEDARISNIRKCKSGKRIATDGGKEKSNAHVVFRSKHPCFIGTMTKKHYRLNIPKALAVAKGLIRKKSVKVEDPNGISWDVKLRLNGKEHRGGHLFMT